jgi:hypothetical protein
VKRPVKWIHVGPHMFEFVWDSDMVGSDGTGATFNSHTMEIRVADGMPESVTKENVLHELLHAAYWLAGGDLIAGKNEENTIRSLQTPLFTILRANPKLMEWILS